MGAWPYDGGVTFRVWAPNATAVSVAGTFDEWDATQHPLAPEEGGTWSVDVPGASDGDEYRFLVRDGDREMWRIDPRARRLTTRSATPSCTTRTAFDWGDQDFALAALERPRHL